MNRFLVAALAAVPMVAILAWALLTVAIEQGTGLATATDQAVAVLATIGFGAILGANVPLRGEVTRYPGSPST